MTNFRTYLALLLSTSLLMGCGSLLRVRKLDMVKPQGVPFYVKTGACVHQTVYATPYYRLTLKLDTGAKNIFSDTISVSSQGHSSANFQALIDELDKPAPDSGSVLQAWKQLGVRQSFDPYNAVSGQITLANTSHSTTFVDYSNPYSINQSKPFSGKSSADFKLASDGTLSEAEGQVEDTTFATIVAALPISDLIKSAAGIASKAAAAASGETEAVKFQLVQEQRYVQTSLSQTTVFAGICPVGKALLSTDTSVAIEVSDIGAKDLNAPDLSKDKGGDTIAITGTIKLPKATTAESSTKTSPSSNPSADESKDNPKTAKKKKS